MKQSGNVLIRVTWKIFDRILTVATGLAQSGNRARMASFEAFPNERLGSIVDRWRYGISV